MERRHDEDDEPVEIISIFTCKINPENHTSHYQARFKTSSGTTNLLNGIKQCDKRNNITSHSLLSSSPSLPYSIATHRTLLALRCATNNRPFNIVNDQFYEIEVDMLRPGTKLPSANTLSRDTTLLYQEMSREVKNHFSVSLIIL